MSTTERDERMRTDWANYYVRRCKDWDQTREDDYADWWLYEIVAEREEARKEERERIGKKIRSLALSVDVDEFTDNMDNFDSMYDFGARKMREAILALLNPPRE